MGGGEGMHIFCTGVWVGSYTILTANHCVEAVAEELGTENPKGLPVEYAIKQHAYDFGKDPSKVYLSSVLALDMPHDLALLRVTGVVPSHSVARLAQHVPSSGAFLDFVGHPGGLPWTHTKGVAAAYRTDLGPVDWVQGPFLQVSGPVWFGNSGGGAFDTEGRLVGIASFIMRAPPLTGFYIPVESIKNFLATQGVP